MYFLIKTNHPLRIALTEQVKHLAECVVKLLQSSESSLPYGIPGPSRVSGSQEQPILLSSDEDIKIKTEKGTIEKSTEKGKHRKETEKCTKKSVRKKTVSKSFYFFYFFYFASHKFFFKKTKFLF